MIDHKQQLQNYFDGEGFTRWQHIYGEAPITGVRKSVREGHARVVEHALASLGPLSNAHILDAGCGTGMLTLALAQQGHRVTAVDIAPQMVDATMTRLQQAGLAERVRYMTSDLEMVKGEFDAVVCLDVLIHYPASLFAPMISKLAGMSRGPLVFTYAPREPLLAALHWVGGKFPKPQRRTEIQMIPDTFVRESLAKAGMRVRRSERVSVGFYHVALIEAVRD